MALFDSISARLGGIMPGRAMPAGIDKVLTEVKMELSSDATVACTTTSWARVGTYTVTPQTTQQWGFGVEGKEQANLGFLQFIPKGVEEASILGEVRLAIVNSEDIVQDYRIPSVRTELLTKALADGKDLVYFLGASGYVGKPYDKLVLEILVDTATTYSTTASTLLVNTTLRI